MSETSVTAGNKTSLYALSPYAPAITKVVHLIDYHLGEGHQTVENLNLLLTTKNYKLWIAEQKGKVVATAAAEVLSATESQFLLDSIGYPSVFGKSIAVGTFHCLVTDPDVRGQGIATLLTKTRINWLQERSVDLIVCLSWKHDGDTSERLLTACGFSEFKQIAQYWKNVHNVNAPCIVCGPHCECVAIAMTLQTSR